MNRFANYSCRQHSGTACNESHVLRNELLRKRFRLDGRTVNVCQGRRELVERWYLLRALALAGCRLVAFTRGADRFLLRGLSGFGIQHPGLLVGIGNAVDDREDRKST